MRALFSAAVFSLLTAAACGHPPAGSVESGIPPWALAEPIAADEQRPGDATRGYDALVNQGYVRCGIPWSIYTRVFGTAAVAAQIPGRTGENAKLPYNQTLITLDSGVKVVSANCLSCHAGTIAGKLIIGVGNTEQDFTTDPSGQAMLAKQLGPTLTSDPGERAELDRWAGRVIAVGPYTTLVTRGVNPGDNFASVLLAHRDPLTLAWSDTPFLELPPMIGVPVDVPPWWRMKKKHSLFYTDAGHGDHARIEMAASNLCTDNVAEAKQIDAWFPDVAAYLESIEPPAWPFPVDGALAARGQPLFESRCAGCHGTYGEGGHYPNLLLPLDVIGTDGLLALGSNQFAARFLDWWKQSFYGERSRLEPKRGYVAPPLDGIWATAPYLHNGSVPTLAALLDSNARPRFWQRTFDSSDYDPTAVGWRFTALGAGHADAPAAQRKNIYDTSILGYSNSGHTYGDALSGAERAAVIEYLKTL